MKDFPASVRFIRFGVFEVDLRTGEVKKKGSRIRLQGQPFLLLVTLLKERGEVVTRDELRQTLWPDDTFVDFNHSLGSAANKLRDALGDSAANPRFIETVPRRGYRFIAPVETISDIESKPVVVEPVLIELPDTAESVDSAAPSTRRSTWSRWAILTCAGLLLLAAALVFLAVRSRGPAIRSLAVLPLENLSGDAAQEYFSDGMTDELITELGQIGDLRVISRTSVMTYKGVHKPLPEIARELNVDAIVEGTVLRSGSSVRIAAQLILASSDKHLWAHSYEVELRDIFSVQKQVASSIVDQVRIKLNPDARIALNRTRRVDAEAYEAYLKGRYFWNKRTAEGLTRATEYFNQATKADPAYANAYSGLADSYALMGDWEYGVMPPAKAFPEAKAAATRALSLDDSLGEAHTSLAFVLDLFDWDWQGAEREYKRALDLNPNYATGHQWYAWHLIVLGRNDDAIAQMRKAESLDPLSLIISADMADVLLISRRFDQSFQQSRKTLELDPNFALAHYQMGEVLVQKHEYEQGIAELQRAVALSGGNKTFESNLAYAYAKSGRRDDAFEIVHRLEKPSGGGFSNTPEIALIYVGLNDKERAMEWLEKSFEQRFNPSILMRPCFDPIRSDTRFQKLLARLGLSSRG